jgi:hypothetical protein
MTMATGWADGAIVYYDEAELNRPGNEPEPAKIWTPLEFMELFTFEERQALRTLAKSDPMAEDWLDLLKASTLVRIDDHRTRAGLDYMVLKGVLSRTRADEILA